MYVVECLLHNTRLISSGRMFRIPDKRQPKQSLFVLDQKQVSADVSGLHATTFICLSMLRTSLAEKYDQPCMYLADIDTGLSQIHQH